MIVTHGICKHCGQKPATRVTMKLCGDCSDELFKLAPGSPERTEWLNAGVN